jgi:hypothetical protein
MFITLITLNKFLLYALGTMQVFTIKHDYRNGLIIFLRILIDFILFFSFFLDSMFKMSHDCVCN